MHRICGLFVLGFAVAFLAWDLLPPSPIAPRAAGSTGAVSPHRRSFQGVGSCAAAACHGGDGPPRIPGSEYTSWINCDPHARAFTVLADDRAERMTKSLRRAVPATRDPLCLACHATGAHPGLRSDGVGCESCHGPAEGWLTRHYQPWWGRQSDRRKEAWGMRPTKDLRVRAKTCAECHVGSAGRDVNHDLIAAGHPRLNFEFGSYHAVLPKHWNVRADRARYPDFEARAWALGQAASAEQALELLASRAAGRNTAPWPEFAEYNCFSCHHALHEPRPWRKQGGGKLAGAPAWGSWYFSDLLPKALAYSTPRAVPTDLFPSLRQQMLKPSPNRDRVVRLARQAAQELRPWLATLNAAPCQAPAVLGVRMRSFTPDGAGPAAITWDAAAQRYLALAAFYNARSDLAPHSAQPGLKASLREMAATLASQGRASPADFDPKRFRQQLRKLQKLLRP
jgi:hypothetical protein